MPTISRPQSIEAGPQRRNVAFGWAGLVDPESVRSCTRRTRSGQTTASMRRSRSVKIATVYFCALWGGHIHRAVSNGGKLTAQGAAEYYWAMFVEPLQ